MKKQGFTYYAIGRGERAGAEVRLDRARALCSRCTARSADLPSQRSGRWPLRPLSASPALARAHEICRLAPAGSNRCVDRDRPLGVLAQREAGDAEIRGLFLNTAGIRDHGCGVAHEIHELHVSERLDGLDVLHGVRSAPRVRTPEASCVSVDARRTPSGRNSETLRRARRPAQSAISRESTLDGRCSVTTPNSRAGEPQALHAVVGGDGVAHHFVAVDHDVADAVDAVGVPRLRRSGSRRHRAKGSTTHRRSHR